MAASKPRMALTLPAEVDAVLRDISEVTGVSPASFVTSILVGMLPSLHQTYRALLHAQKGQVEFFDMLQNTLFEAQAQASQAGLELGEMRKLSKTKGLRRPKVDGSE